MTATLERPSVQFVLVTLLLAVFASLAVTSLAGKSITTDEVPHIAAGYSYWATGDFRCNPEHPPLTKLLAGLPLLFLEPKLDTGHETWDMARTGDQGIRFGFHFHFETPENLDRHLTLLFWSRLPLVLVGLVFCLYLFFLARLLYGVPAALLTLTVAAFSPTVLAHTRLVTTDVAITAFWVGAIYHMIRFLRKPGWGQLTAAGALTGLAMASKFSGILALAVTGFVCAVSLFSRGGPWSAPEDRPIHADLGPRVGRWAGHMLAYTAVAFGVVLVTYFGGAFFDYYFKGFDRVFANHDPRYRSFFLGHHSHGIIWSYYLVALAIKVPLGTLALAALGLFGRRPGSTLGLKERALLVAVGLVPLMIVATHLAKLSPVGKIVLVLVFLGWSGMLALAIERGGLMLPAVWVERLLIVTPALVIFGVSTISGKYLGVRYVLPCLPLLFLLAGRTMTLRWTARWPGRAVPAALALYVAVSSLLAWPNYIPYFNEGAREAAAEFGSAGRYSYARLLDDSNIDWGQDWLDIAAFQKENGITDLGYWAHNRIEPEKPYGVMGHTITEEEQYLPHEGWYVVGAHTMNRDYLHGYNRPVAYDWLERYEPVRVFGGSSFLFRFWIRTPDHPVPEGFRGTVLTEAERYDQALERLARARRLRPDSAGVLRLEAELLERMGRTEDALSKLQECCRVADQAARDALKTIRETLDARTLARQSREGQMRYMQFRQFRLDRLLELHQELIQAAIFATRFRKPDVSIALLSTALDVANRFREIPEALQPWSLWARRWFHDRYQTLMALTLEYAKRYVLQGDGRDLTTVRRLSREADQMMQQAGRRVHHDPNQAIAEARKVLAETAPGSAPEAPRGDQ